VTRDVDPAGSGQAPDVLLQGDEGRGPRRGTVALLLVATLAAALVGADRWERSREVDVLFARADDGRAAVVYADGRIDSAVRYASPALLSGDVEPAVRSSLQALVSEAAAGQVADLRAARNRAAAVRVLPWHGAERTARSRFLTYLDTRIGYVQGVARDFDELYAPHPRLAQDLLRAREAYAQASPGDPDRLTRTFGGPS